MAVTTDPKLEKLSVDTIRTLSMDAVEQANSGHPGTPMALAPVAYSLYTQVMNYDPADPEWINRDRFILSAGHASMLLYSILHLTGFDLTLDDLKAFRQLHSKTPGHPEYKHTQGVETTTGPLGQGISTAVGMALGERMLNARFGDVIDHFTYVIASDGDMQEGIQAEAASLAGHLNLRKLIAFYDDNHISIEGDTSISFSESVGDRYRAYGWEVIHLGEDIEVERITNAFKGAQATDKPTLIVARTHIGYGAPTLQDTGKAHGSPLGDEEIRAAKEYYGFPSQEPFFVPDGVYDHYKAEVARRAEAHTKWEEQYGANVDPELIRIVKDRRPPAGWDATVPTKTPAELESIATRKASEEAIQWVASKVPEFVGGSADLAGSTNTIIDGADSVQAGEYGGRNLHFGIREHGMGAVVNGLVMSGFRAYGATFLTFSDYMKGALRIAAIMRIPSVTVFTHDSIGLGEDGPTHQPVEQLTALRATPNLDVIRPADYNETQLAWQFAINSMETPIAFSFSRQGAPTLDPAKIPPDAIARGAYVYDDTDGEPEVILIGTGTELSLAIEAAGQLGGRARVVSMPCMETFAAQDQAYRDSVLPPTVKARVAVEAASPMSWYRWIGDFGETVCMETFGASAPAPEVYAEFNITADAVAAAANQSMERSRA